MKEHVFIDMDGVLADFDAQLRRYQAAEANPPHLTDDDLVDYYCHQEGFYRTIPPIEGAIEAYKELGKRFNVYILSTPSWNNPSSYTDKRFWVEEFLGDAAYKRLILSHNKGLFTGRALIDDRTKNGVLQFKGEHIHFGTDRFPHWDAVLAHLL